MAGDACATLNELVAYDHKPLSSLAQTCKRSQRCGSSIFP